MASRNGRGGTVVSWHPEVARYSIRVSQTKDLMPPFASIVRAALGPKQSLVALQTSAMHPFRRCSKWAFPPLWKVCERQGTEETVGEVSHQHGHIQRVEGFPAEVERRDVLVNSVLLGLQQIKRAITSLTQSQFL